MSEKNENHKRQKKRSPRPETTLTHQGKHGEIGVGNPEEGVWLEQPGWLWGKAP